MEGRPLLCRLGLHRNAFVWGDFNRYYECSRCGRRGVVIGRGGYQPIASWWLCGQPDEHPILPSGGSGVVRR